MKKVLFLIHDLGPGGAEKVLVNLVNNMDRERYDVTVMSLFDVGINKQFLAEHIHYRYCFKTMVRGNSHMMKLLSPESLHRWLIKESYDVEVAYLEGPCARIVSGCRNPETKLFAWIHIEQHTAARAAASFRSVAEATACYNRFDRINCVSQTVMEDFRQCLDIHAPMGVVYNTNETDQILEKAKEPVTDGFFRMDKIKLVGVGKLLKSKGFDRILRIVKALKDKGLPVHFYLLGVGEEENALKQYVEQNGLQDNVDFLGYQVNPYKFISRCDLFVCASFREGFSTAATEALILGVPVCTVEVSGMREMLGNHNEFGVVTENDDDALYLAVAELVTNPDRLHYYKNRAIERGHFFSKERTVRSVENILDGVCE